MKKNIFFALAFLCFLFNNCKQEDEIKIGILVPLSGNGAVAGESIKRGVELAVAEQNNKGGIQGKKIILDIQDTKGEPKEGINIIKKMLSSTIKPVAVFSAISGVALAITPETEKNEIIHFSSVGTPKLLENTKYCIRNYISAPLIGQKISDFLKDSTSVKNFGIFYSNNEFGASVKDALLAQCYQKGVHVVFNEPYEEKALDYKTLISAKLTKDIDYLYIVGIGKGLGTLIKQVKENGYNGKIIGDPLINFPDVINAAQGFMSGIPYLDFSFDRGNPTGSEKEFVDSFRARYNSEPQILSLINYDAAKFLFSSIEANKEKVNLINQLNKTTNFTGLSGEIEFKNNEILHPLKIKTFK